MSLRTALFICVFWLCPIFSANAQINSASSTPIAYPNRVINIVVPVGPGGSYDYLGRLLADGLSKELGQPVVVENRPGAGTTIGTQYVAKSAPDGYTIVVGGVGSISQAVALNKDLPFNPHHDLIPLQLVSTNGYALIARADLPQKNLTELIAFARSRPGKLTIGMPGQGSGQAVGAALLASLAGIELLEVPFKGAAPIYTEMLASRIDLFFDATGTALPFIKSGRVKPLLTSGENRELTDIPTAKESGMPELVLSSWTGLFVPSLTPRTIVLKLRQAIENVALTSAFKEHLVSRNFISFVPQDVEAFVKSENQRWPQQLAKAGVKAQ